MTNNVMNLFGDTLRELRLSRGLLLRTVASRLDIDPAILSKIEHGKRKAKRAVVEEMEVFYNQEPGKLISLWLSDRIVNEIQEEPDPGDILKVAEEALIYKRASKAKQAFSPKAFMQVFSRYPAIRKAWVFGSHARQEAGPESDLDILLEVRDNSRITLFDLAEIGNKLSMLSGKKIDVVLSRSLRPEVFKRIELERKLIYEA
jgi:predicted nucleotidyltransferase